MELANFDCLAPHFIKEGLLTNSEYQDITQRNGVSPQQHFKIFVTEILLKPGKGNIVEKFVTSLTNEEKHIGHKDLLERIKKIGILMNAIGNYIIPCSNTLMIDSNTYWPM